MGFAEGINKFIRKIYPENAVCYVCGREIFSGEAVCAECARSLPYNVQYCPRCGRNGGFGAELCLECKQSAPIYEKARAPFCYEGKIRQMLIGFKSDAPYLAAFFANDCARIVQTQFADADFITFVPLSERRQRQRGFNQGERLALAISEKTGLPVQSVLEKRRDTAEQKTLSRAERQKNLKGAFHLHLRKVCKGKAVLVVDDALTTGATAEEICRLLKGAGARKTYVLTVASVPARAMKK